ncbi:MAG: sigma-70 family RNA polymerase sigma factor [Lachnospiraceae bacterium]|nr:sigma-70 family RNA polymerase sigma factor [Lachnospiraceae bacterium]
MNETKELQIVKLLKDKNPDGMKLLLYHYKPFIYYIITPILPNQDDREECISEISIQIWEKIRLFDSEKGKFLSWFTAFVKNTALNYAKKNVKYDGYEDINVLKDIVSSDILTPEEIILKKEREEELLNAVNKLKKQVRLIFYRKYYYMQSTEQIALEFGTTVRAIEGKLYRIKKQLRK